MMDIVSAILFLYSLRQVGKVGRNYSIFLVNLVVIFFIDGIASYFSVRLN